MDYKNKIMAKIKYTAEERIKDCLKKVDESKQHANFMIERNVGDSKVYNQAMREYINSLENAISILRGGGA